MWEDFDKNGPLIEGQTYRTTFFLALPDTLDWRNRVVNTIKNGAKFIHSLPDWAQLGFNRLIITKVETGVAPQNSITGKVKPWPLRITFTVGKQPMGGGGHWVTVGENGEQNFLPAVLLAPEVLEGLALLIGIATVAFVIVNKSIEHLVAPVFNPAVLILVVVAIFLIVGAKHGRVSALR